MRMRSLPIFLAIFCLPLSVLAQSVVNGDTLYVGQTKYRLCGIDAPEHGRPGYHQAVDYLHSLVRGKTIKCTPVGQGTPCDGRSETSNYDLIVAQRFVGGEDLAAKMVRAG